MNIKTKFDLGQEVWTISYYQKPIYVKCNTCHGKSTITIEGEEFRCPKYCSDGQRAIYGDDIPKGHHMTCGPKKWHISNYGYVGKIGAEIYRDKRDNCNNTPPIHYMISSTGVGSGSIWYEEYVFESEELAQAECEARNAKVAE